MRKVVLYIAVSLDGYIADPDGSIDWLTSLPDGQETSYPEFIETVDTVIMGHRTYEQLITQLSPGVWPYPDKLTYVLSHGDLADQEQIKFTRESLPSLLGTLIQQPGKDIWLCGGANVVNQGVQNDLIDRYHITVIPRLIGQGLRLFQENHISERSGVRKGWYELELIHTQQYDSLTDLVYERKQTGR